VRDAMLRVMAVLLSGYRSHVIWRPAAVVAASLQPADASSDASAPPLAAAEGQDAAALAAAATAVNPTAAIRTQLASRVQQQLRTTRSRSNSMGSAVSAGVDQAAAPAAGAAAQLAPVEEDSSSREDSAVEAGFVPGSYASASRLVRGASIAPLESSTPRPLLARRGTSDGTTTGGPAAGEPAAQSVQAAAAQPAVPVPRAPNGDVGLRRGLRSIHLGPAPGLSIVTALASPTAGALRAARLRAASAASQAGEGASGAGMGVAHVASGSLILLSPARQPVSAAAGDSFGDGAASPSTPEPDMCFVFDTRRFIACAPLDLQPYLREVAELQAFTRCVGTVRSRCGLPCNNIQLYRAAAKRASLSSLHSCP
jgi:hypothetical protein